jgi:hypothetical protein
MPIPPRVNLHQPHLPSCSSVTWYRRSRWQRFPWQFIRRIPPETWVEYSDSRGRVCCWALVHDAYLRPRLRRLLLLAGCKSSAQVPRHWEYLRFQILCQSALPSDSMGPCTPPACICNPGNKWRRLTPYIIPTELGTVACCEREDHRRPLYQNNNRRPT